MTNYELHELEDILAINGLQPGLNFLNQRVAMMLPKYLSAA